MASNDVIFRHIIFCYAQIILKKSIKFKKNLSELKMANAYEKPQILHRKIKI